MLVLRPGLLYAIKHTLRLTPSGLLWLGIPCSMLVFISLGTSKRGVGEWDELGDTSLPSVQRSNLHLSRASLLALLAMSRCAWWCCEQPSTSRLPQLRYYADLLNDDNITTSFIRLPGSKILVCDSSRICPWFHFVFGCILFAELDGAVFPLDSEAIMLFGTWLVPQNQKYCLQHFWCHAFWVWLFILSKTQCTDHSARKPIDLFKNRMTKAQRESIKEKQAKKNIEVVKRSGGSV